MSDCEHLWEMTNIQFGFIVFEKCSHCNSLRTYFSKMPGDDYREGDHIWRAMLNAQSFRFDLRCKKCGHLEKFDDLMGLMYCTGCLSDCEVEVRQRELETKKTGVMVAFGFLPKSVKNILPAERLKILEGYFNQRRDTSRSKIAILSYDLIKDFSHCRGEFLYDVDMLSLQPPGERKSPF